MIKPMISPPSHPSLRASWSIRMVLVGSPPGETVDRISCWMDFFVLQKGQQRRKKKYNDGKLLSTKGPTKTSRNGRCQISSEHLSWVMAFSLSFTQPTLALCFSSEFLRRRHSSLPSTKKRTFTGQLCSFSEMIIKIGGFLSRTRLQWKRDPSTRSWVSHNGHVAPIFHMHDCEIEDVYVKCHMFSTKSRNQCGTMQP